MLGLIVQPRTVYIPQLAPTSMKQRERLRLSRITGEVSLSHSRRPDQNKMWPTESNSVGDHRHCHPVPYIVNGSNTQLQGKNFRTVEGRNPRWHAQLTDPRNGCRRTGKPRAFSIARGPFTRIPRLIVYQLTARCVQNGGKPLPRL